VEADEGVFGSEEGVGTGVTVALGVELGTRGCCELKDNNNCFTFPKIK
jgi:hypothetical protein